MPFRSEAQRRFMYAEHPDIARKWSAEYPGQGPQNLPQHVAPKGNGREEVIRRLMARKGLPQGR